MFALGFVIPAIVTVAEVEFASAQVPLSVIVTAWPTVTPVVVPVQVPVKPEAKVTVGVAGRTKPEAKVAVSVFDKAPLSAPVAVLLNPTVHTAVAPADCGEPVKATAVTMEIGTAAAGFAATVSAEVATLNAEAA